MASETGAAIHIAPNCNGLLKRLGLDVRQHGSVEMLGLTEYLPSGVEKFSIDTRPINRMMWQHEWQLIHRAHLHSALKEIAVSPEGRGNPVKLNLSSAVESVDPVNATINLVDGTTHRGDLVLGADGVHSKTRKAIPGGDLKPFDSGKTAYRFLIPISEIAADPAASVFLKHDGHFSMCMGADRRVVMYPCVGKTQMNFVAIYPSSESAPETDGDSWQHAGSKDRMLKIFESFGEPVIAALRLADESQLKTWTLLDMEKMPSFVHDRFAVLGDAAHPFLPRKSSFS
jgi:2-polyprenyl-6-methoxyphenol hydroxylase-like FAD-dependent oxidoreductase